MPADITDQLIALFVENGLLQFGSFARVDSVPAPYLASFELLASYPAALNAIADIAASHVRAGNYARLLCTYDAVSFGVALALRTSVPLVYSRGTNEGAATDLVGGYDIGHKTLLVTNVAESDPLALPLVKRARTVGLETTNALVILDAGGATLGTRALLRLDDAARLLEEAGALSTGHLRVILAWLSR
jgi:orotate phosphoribosyltransferase